MGRTGAAEAAEAIKYLSVQPPQENIPVGATAPKTSGAEPANSNMQHPLAGFLADIKEARGKAMTGDFGKVPLINDEGRPHGVGEITGWANRGRVYPAGFSAADIPAIEKAVAGKPLTPKQQITVDRALREVRKLPSNASEAIQTSKQTVELNEADIPENALVFRNGEWHKAKAGGEGTILEDGSVTEIPSFDSIKARGMIRPGENGYEEALKQFNAQEKALTGKPGEVRPAVQPDVPSAGPIAVRTKVVVGGGPRTGEVLEVMPRQEGDLPNETYYKVKIGNETQTMESRDIKPVSGVAITKGPARDLDSELTQLGMEPSVFKSKAEKKAAIDRAEKMAKERTVGEKAINVLDRVEESARKRIAERKRQGRMYSGVDPEPMLDYAVIGAVKISKGVIKFSQWSAEMLSEFGEAIRPYLLKVYKDALRMSRRAKSAKSADEAETALNIPEGYHEIKTVTRAAELEQGEGPFSPEAEVARTTGSNLAKNTKMTALIELSKSEASVDPGQALKEAMDASDPIEKATRLLG